MSTTIAIVTDIHHGQDGFSKKASIALDIFPDFARFANDAKPDLVLDLGDRISDENEATDLRLEREVADAFKAVEAPIRHICGNHDVDFITPAQNTEIFGQEMVSEALDLGDWRLLIWRADAKNYKGLGFALPEHDLLWLATQIARADRPIAVFSHVPLSDHDVRANYWFSQNPKSATYPNSHRIRAILESARVPVVCFSGHVHWNTLNRINGIPYATLQSLTESFTTPGEPARAWTLLELDENIALETFGNDAVQWRLPREQTTNRWIAPVPPFPDNPEIKARAMMSKA